MSADATDDAGVAGVTMSWSGTTVPMSSVAWTWSGTFGGFTNADVPTSTYTDVAVTVTAVDAAGASAAAQVTVRVRYCPV
ncbi:hypothetical protein [Cellulomonas sp. KRMCY2]|uniref:hypothetical protein n=1 Tax=Cellulomonas sp. KRMCY2 TaxID=1304865 RepID=UPI00045E6415|nr:hypothetical protein [Cellulomonas sp. KRMCY2]